MPKPDQPAPALSATGTAGLDYILGGGFTPNRLYLIEGDPGAARRGCTSLCRRRRRRSTPSPSPTAGRSTRSTWSSWSRPRRA